MSLRRCLCLLFLAACCWADFRDDVCQRPTVSCGPVPPVLPGSFVMKGARVDLKNQRNFVWFEEYFDPDNLRAKYVEVSNGEESHYILDYQSEQVVSYLRRHPGAAANTEPAQGNLCISQDMSASPLAKSVLGLKFSGSMLQGSRMYTSYETLRYGGPHLYAYLNDSASSDSSLDDERALDVLKFKGCVYDKYADASYDMTFEWSGEKVSPAFGARSVPVRIQEMGGYYAMEQGQEKPSWHEVQTVKSIAWFQEDPYMDPEIFQPPVRMTCLNQATTDPSARPSLPNSFSARMETFVNVQDTEGKRVAIERDSYSEVWYDSVANLVRLDYVPDMLEELALLLYFDKEAMVTSVHDFNNGISFYTDKVQGLCISMPIPMSGSLFLSKRSTPGNAVLATPQEALGVDETLKYKGRYRIRGMDSKGYSGAVTDSGTDDPKLMLREIYFTTDGWHQDLDGEEDFDWPIRSVQLFTGTLKGQTAQFSTETNFYKFKSMAPSFKIYDIAGCTLDMKKAFYQITFRVSGGDRDFVKQWYDAILQELHGALVNRANVGSPLRVQDTQILFPEDGRIVFSFTLLDVFTVTGDVTSPRKGLPLDKAVAALRSDVNIGLFEVPVKTDPMMTEKLIFKAVPNSLVEMIKIPQTKTPPEILAQPRTLVPAQPFLRSQASKGHYVAETVPQQEAEEEKKEEEEKKANTPKPNGKKSKGYTKGALAGLGVAMLIVGLALGVAAMLFYFKKYQRRKDTETADFVLTASSSSH